MEIRFFGRLRDALGGACGVSAEEGETVARLRRRLAGLHPQAARDLLGPRVRASVAETIVGEGFCLDGHDRIDLLPPLSGG